MLSLRLKRLQAVVHDFKLEGLLLLPGQDGRNNLGSHQAISYLIGRSNRECIDPAPLPDGLDDSIILIQASGLSVYLPRTKLRKGQANEFQESLISHGAQLFGPTAEEMDDPDLAEEAKIGSMVQMLRGLKVLGLPVEVSGIAEGGSKDSSDTSYNQSRAETRKGG